jgi:tetratricopeptide (TPR) repeat protein
MASGKIADGPGQFRDPAACARLSGSTMSAPPESGDLRDRFPAAGLALLLVALCVGVFGWSTRHGFLDYDDDLYVTENALVRQGLTAEGAAQAFHTVHSLTWHPLTTLSHMLDCELFGLNPSGHHGTSVLLHAATAIALMLVLRRMTGAPWASAAVAFLFAVHPLRVESVAWVSERKDVLSGFLFVLTLGAYTRFVRAGRFVLSNYLLVVLLFALGLLAKPMVATLPFVLLLVDGWPLGRLGEPGAPLRHLGRRVVEKLPLFALSAAASAITLATQQAAMTSSETLGLGARVANAIVAYGVYVRQLVWPLGLSIVYPHPRDTLPVWEVGLVLAGLVLATGLCWRAARRSPAVLVGWLWFLGMLVPVIGLVQVGIQAHADRYSYLPHIGLLVAVVFGLRAVLPQGLPSFRKALAACAVIVLVLCGLSWRQVGFWRTDEALWTHALAITEDNAVAHAQLGSALLSKGEEDLAVIQFRAALAIQPDYATPHYNLGNVLSTRGDLKGAVEEYRLAVAARPDYVKALNNLGSTLVRARQLEEGMTALEEALRLDPNHAGAHGNLAIALGKSGRLPEAIEHLERAAQLDPGNQMRHYDLAMALNASGQGDRARAALLRAIDLAEARGDTTFATIARSNLARMK